MATTTRAKRRKLEAEKQQLLEIQNDAVDSQDSEDEEYTPNTPNPEPSEEFKSNSSEHSNHSLIVDDSKIEKKSLVSTKRKSCRPKNCFVWKFFSEPENDYVTCQVANCKAKLKYCNTPATMKTQLHNSLTQLVIGTDQPLSIVEEPDFIKYSYNLNPKYKLPCIKKLKEHINNIYDFANSKVEEELLCNANDVSLTLDL
jgi:hypothetical protein